MVGEKFREIKEQEFPEVIKNGVVVMDFFAEWCMPCKMMAEVYQNLSNKINDAGFFKINIQEAQNISQKFEVSSLPCTIIFVDGKEVDRIPGNVPEDFLEEKIKFHLN
jgi:thioredoxin 1